MNDFDYGILEVTDHRPWPMPGAPWLMTQSWHDLLFAHWPVDAEALRGRIPAAFELDMFDGQAWVAVVPFRMTNVAPRGVPALPWLSAFPELNVRTYVRAGGKPGVYFFSLDATNPVAVSIARTFVHLPYFSAVMTLDERDGWIHYDSRRTVPAATAEPAATFTARYRAAGPSYAAVPGTLERFLTERYCLYTTKGSRAYRLEIHHPPWCLQPAEAEITVNTTVDAAGLARPAAAPLLHFSRRQDVVTWGLKKV